MSDCYTAGQWQCSSFQNKFILTRRRYAGVEALGTLESMLRASITGVTYKEKCADGGENSNAQCVHACHDLVS